MFLPKSVLLCMQALEQAGFEAFAVGGCVRDSLLGLTPHDYDLCTNALPEQTASLFDGYTLVRSGEKHGTIGVVVEGEVIEITTFRTEGGYQDSRHPDWVRFVSSIEEDLSRRDFTVNAMAYNPVCGYVDPFGGKDDLQNKILRTVGDPQARFSEDALRILRGVRFGVRFHLTAESATLQAMRALAPLMDKLARERVFDELCKLLPLVKAKDLLTYSDILTQVVPPLAPCVGFLQHNPHHKYDVYTHTAKVVESVPGDLAIRWAALLHDCGKPDTFFLDETGRGHFHGHAKVSAEKADRLLLSLRAPTALRERVVFLIAHHMTELTPDRKLLRRRLGKYGIDATFQLLALQEADFGSKGTDEVTDTFSKTRSLLEELLAEDACLTVQDLQVDGRDLLAIGFPAGKLLGSCLAYLLEQVQDEQLPNEKEALLERANAFLQGNP
ncbi:MAG: HD domain-containing protein [Oscillospiraceae bacterium]|nr:HD domain-containing protein [Oscillospiraceae bacterium]